MAPFDPDISKNPANGGMAMQSYFIQSGAEQTTLEKREVACPNPDRGSCCCACARPGSTAANSSPAMA